MATVHVWLVVVVHLASLYKREQREGLLTMTAKEDELEGHGETGRRQAAYYKLNTIHLFYF